MSQPNQPAITILHSGASVPKIMWGVVLAMLPAVVVQGLFFGVNFLVNLFVAVASSLFFEWLILRMRRLDARVPLYDGSAAITAVILALSLPTNLPIGYVVFACGFAIVLGKQLYGGLGFNLFNPAMVGYAATLVSFPSLMSQWQTPQWLGVDAVTSATALDNINWLNGADPRVVWDTLAMGDYWSYRYAISATYILGGLWLVWRGIISWTMPFFFLLTCAALMWIFHETGLNNQTVLLSMLSGGIIFAAFFIITDPMSCASSPKGRIVQAILVGVLVMAIRTWSIYPDGVAFAVLIGNFAAPTLDLFFRTTIYGSRKQ